MTDAPVDTTPIAPAVAPRLYAVLWNLAVNGPLRAQEIADDHNCPRAVVASDYWTAQATALRLRPLQRLGIVGRDADGFWFLTDRGRAWMRFA